MCQNHQTLAHRIKIAGSYFLIRYFPPFMMYKPASSLGGQFKTDDKVLVQGVVDLFINGKKKILVDFKYSRLDDERIAEKYKTQLYLYKSAIESAVSAKIDRIVIYSFLTGSTIDLTI